MIDVSKSGLGDGQSAERWITLITHPLLSCCKSPPLVPSHGGLVDNSASEGKTLNGYELSGWIKVTAEQPAAAEGEKTAEAEGDFVFLYDFRNTKG